MSAATSNRSPKRRTIARAAQEAGVNVETVRYYERLGLIAQPQNAAGYRVYPEAAVRRLRFIRNAKQLGFSLKEIAELAGMAESKATCEDMCARMEDKIAEIDARIHQLTALRNEIAAMVSDSPREGAHTNCKAFCSMDSNER